jgi:hypothetical protein
MKHLLLLMFIAAVLGGCSKDSSVNPVAPEKAATATRTVTGQTAQDIAPSSPADDRTDARIRMELQELTKVLGLTARQQAAVLDILKKKYAMEQQLRRQYQNDPAKLRVALAQLQARTDAAIMNLLTREQLLRWKRWKAATSGGTRG